jgi:hypothetical protein
MFKEIENAIGKFLYANPKFMAGKDRRMGKFLVEIDLFEGLSAMIEIAWGGSVIHQRLDFVGVPFRCLVCRETCHMKFHCKDVSKKVRYGSYEGFNELDEDDMCAPTDDLIVNQLASTVQSVLELGKSIHPYPILSTEYPEIDERGKVNCGLDLCNPVVVHSKGTENVNLPVADEFVEVISEKGGVDSQKTFNDGMTSLGGDLEASLGFCTEGGGVVSSYVSEVAILTLGKRGSATDRGRSLVCAVEGGLELSLWDICLLCINSPRSMKL